MSQPQFKNRNVKGYFLIFHWTMEPATTEETEMSEIENKSFELGTNTRNLVKKKKKEKSKVISYLTKAFHSQNTDFDETQFQHSSQAEEELTKLEKKQTFHLPPKKSEKNIGKAITSRDLSTDERNTMEVKFSNVLLYNAFMLLIMLLVRIG
jgi:hypothetical protein